MTNETVRNLPFRKRLRVRVMASFTLLALAPFLFWMGVLFYIARKDVLSLAGQDIVERAAFLAGELTDEISQGSARIGELAKLEEVRRHILEGGPYPTETLSLAQRIEPDVENIALEAGAGPAADSRNVELLESGRIVVRVPVVDEGGASLGRLTATLKPESFLAPLSRFSMGESGEAVLVAGKRLLGASRPQAVAPADVVQAPGEPWGTFESGEARWFAARTSLKDETGRVGGGWQVIVSKTQEEILRPFYSMVLLAAFLTSAMAGMVILLAWRFAGEFLRPLHEIRHGAEIISNINLSHRIDITTGDEMEALAEEFNEMAEALGNAYGALEGRVNEMTLNLQEERNRLAAVLRAMSEGVVVMNEVGDVILMNPRARAALRTGPSTGIGARLSKLLPAPRLDHYLRRLRAAWGEQHHAVENVLFPLAGGKVLRGGITAIPDNAGGRAGFLLVFRDVSEDAARDLRVEESLRELPTKLRGPLSNLVSITDILEQRAEMPEGKRVTFLHGLKEEVGRCLALIEEGQRVTVDVRSARWPPQPADPRELVVTALTMVPGVFARHEIPEGLTFPPVAVEPYGWIAALATAIRWLAGHSAGLKPLEARLEVEDEMIVITFHLSGDVAIEPAELEALAVELPGEDPYTLGEAVRRNHGEIWTRRVEEGFEVRLGMMRASVLPEKADAQVFDDQPEFYDFDLFLSRPGVEPEKKLGAALAALDFVVLDTETTGLNPSQGDKVVSLSAVRVRGGKVYKADTFHTLVNPGMKIPLASIAFHGITDDMVEGQPTLAEVLPRFFEYVGDAVMVGHNVAFDKKFLEMEAREAAIPFPENPVLDTLFLSYGIHGDLEGHSLDAIAERMGVTVEGRHTSLGDARATAEIFVHLIPLLATREISTLAEAKAFCDKMLLLRWQMSRY